MISDYLEALQLEARRAGVDGVRLVIEISDYLHESTATYEAAGRPRHDAEALAVADLGDPADIVSSIGAIGGGFMKNRIRIVAIATGLIATIALWTSHAIPGGDIVDSPFATISLLSLFALLAAAAALVGTQHSGFAIFTAVLSVVGGWAVATSAAFDMRIEVVSGGHWLTLLTTATVVGVLGKVLQVRAVLGIALVAAGLASLVLNGAHESYGGIGDGQGNIGVALSTLGWAWISVSLSFDSWGRAQAERIRRRVAMWFESAAERVAPDNIA